MEIMRKYAYRFEVGVDDVLSVSDGKAVEDPNGNLANEREFESLKVVPPQQLVQITPTGRKSER